MAVEVGRRTMIDLAPFLRRACASRIRRGARLWCRWVLSLLLLMPMLVLLRSHGAWGFGSSIFVHASAVVLRIAQQIIRPGQSIDLPSVCVTRAGAVGARGAEAE